MTISVPEFLFSKSVDASLELGAYEHMWLNSDASVKSLAELFSGMPDALPSDLVDEDVARETAAKVLAEFALRGITNFGLRVHGADAYPRGLRDAKEPIDLLYFRGCWELATSPRRVSVVGTRNMSVSGEARTVRLVRHLVDADFTVVSGLAKGVDTAAHRTAIDAGGRTIAVIGTPITQVYPRENHDLQEEIATDFLLVSQVPVLRYAKQNYRWNRGFFPERNKTMSALSEATIIVEAGETSGTLIQAKAALAQGRKLFILENNFQNPALSWPARFERLGAIRVREFEDILQAMN